MEPIFHNITKFDILFVVMKTKIIFNCGIVYTLKSQEKMMRIEWFHESSSRLIIPLISMFYAQSYMLWRQKFCLKYHRQYFYHTFCHSIGLWVGIAICLSFTAGLLINSHVFFVIIMTNIQTLISVVASCFNKVFFNAVDVIRQ